LNGRRLPPEAGDALTLIVIPAIFGLVKGLRPGADDHINLRTTARTTVRATDLRVPEPAEQGEP
jgi:hypothetical protein